MKISDSELISIIGDVSWDSRCLLILRIRISVIYCHHFSSLAMHASEVYEN